MMAPRYRYINADHTLVMRDDHVIAWDPNDNKPAPTTDGKELQMWQGAGSPQPQAAPASASTGGGVAPTTPKFPIYLQPDLGPTK
jgi:hypothetical protein